MALTSRDYKKKAGKKKKGGKSPFQSLKSFFTGIKDFFQSEKLHQIIGLVLIFTSLYMLIAFCSFLFTWEVDQDKVKGDLLIFMLDRNIEVQNWLGKTGTIVSHQFIHNWFGISSFLFVIIVFLFGFKTMTKISLIPLGKTTAYILLSVVLLSLTFGYFFDDEHIYLGGTIGYQINLWLTTILGEIGTGMFIVLIGLAILIALFNPMQLIEQYKHARKEKVEAKEGWSTVKEDEPLMQPVLTNVQTEENINKEDPKISPDQKVDNDTTSSIELNTDIPESSDDAPPGDDISMTVEHAAPKDEVVSEKEINKHKEEFGEYDPTLDLGSYQLPPVDLLEEHASDKVGVEKEELENNKNKIVETLRNYNIEIAKIKATIGPTVTLYEIVPAAGVRISKIKNLEDDIALSLSALGIRIIAPIPGKGTIGIEVPNLKPEIVSMKSIISSEKFQNTDFELPIALGKTISNETFVADLTSMPHLLMAGATGQGKSVGLNAILVSLLYKKHPSQIKFVLVDPKKVELTLFNKIERHFLAVLPGSEEAIITDTKKVIHTLNSLCIEMDQRYELLKIAQTRNIKEYNLKFIDRKLNPENGHRFLPYIILVIDEFADLIMTSGKEIETPIARLAQLARAIGIHLIIATQRPSVNIITGTIKANFPARIAFRVTAKIDSRTILDEGGADQLIGKGDMLLATGNTIIRLQCAFVDAPEVERITDFIGSQRAYPAAYQLPEYVDENAGSGVSLDGEELDQMFEDAARVIVQNQQGSTSLIQRKLKLGYNRAGRIIDQLEAAGIVGPFEGSKARQVLMPDEFTLEQFLNSLNEPKTKEPES